MDSGLITAFAVVLGSLVGALGSAAGTWITQRHQDRRDLLGTKVISREALYSDFIAESARLLVDALEHNVSDPQKLIPVYALDEPHSTQFIGARSGNGRGSHKNDSARLFSAELDTRADTVAGRQ
jgi:hypothetical protein